MLGVLGCMHPRVGSWCSAALGVVSARTGLSLRQLASKTGVPLSLAVLLGRSLIYRKD